LYVTVIEALLEPLLHVPPTFPEITTEFPAQKVVLPLADMLDALLAA
jgi:hypothetical protein